MTDISFGKYFLMTCVFANKYLKFFANIDIVLCISLYFTKIVRYFAVILTIITYAYLSLHLLYFVLFFGLKGYD